MLFQLLLLVSTMLPLNIVATSNDSSFTVPLIPHHQQLARRGLTQQQQEEVPLHRRRRLHDVDRQLQGESTLQIGALYQGYGTHYVDLWVGSPHPQRQTVIVDTGSGVTAFPCSGCSDCGKDYHIDKFFQEEDSESFHKLACDECSRGSCSKSVCHIGMSYAEGSSWSAYEARDLLYAGGPHDEPLVQQQDNGGTDVDPLHASAFAFPLNFGCQTKITGLFKTQLADGIMGMDSASSSYWHQMHEHGRLKKKRFALCYSRQPTSTREGTEAGALTFGEFDTRLHTSPMVYSKASDSFSVKIRAVYLRAGGGGDSATSTDPNLHVIRLDISQDTLQSKRAIVDSGTTDTYFSSIISTEFNNVFKELTGQKYGHDPVDLTPEQLDALPTILLQLAGDEEYNKQLYGNDSSSSVTGLAGQNALDENHPHDVIVAIPPSHYMEFDHKKSKYIARFYVNERGKTVLGGNAIMGHDVYFDLEHTRIGWAESKCDYTELVSKYDTGNPPSLEPETSEKEAVDNKDDVEKPTDKPAETKPTDQPASDNKIKPNPSDEKTHDDDSEHEKDKHVDEPGEVEKDASHVESTQLCTGMTCRATLAATLVGVLFVGIFVGRTLTQRRLGPTRYHGTELEVPTLHLDEDDAVDFSTRYRDNPEGGEAFDGQDDSNVVDEGVGYEDDDELDPREIA